MKLTIKEVERRFNDAGYTLLEENYVCTKTPMKCRCRKGHEIKKTVYSLGKTQCPYCVAKRINQPYKHSYGYVKSVFDENGCVLLSDKYERAKGLLDYICVCGTKAKISFDSFRRGGRCKQCALDKQSINFRHDYEYVRKYFQDNGCKLLSTEYTNSKILLQYVCVCGETSYISFNNFKKGRRCKACGIRNGAEKTRRSIEEVRRIFEDRGCKLLSNEYINDRTNLQYICECGEESEIKLVKFLAGQNCRECGIKKNSGENHHNWSNVISFEDRFKTRKLPGHQRWRQAVLNRDNNSCLMCKNEISDILNVHHIFNYANHPELVLEVRNGATLCIKCHISFHQNYGYTNNNLDQFKEWLGDKYADHKHKWETG